jgi:beta-xylosidase
MPVSRPLAVFAFVVSVVSSAAAAIVEPSFVPVYEDNFPDPFIAFSNGEFIAYSTNDGPNLPMLTSRDLVHWSRIATPDGRRIDGMPRMAPWAKPDRTWAPEVARIGDKWLLYYTAAHAKKPMQCIGVAIAARPQGPFVDNSSEPLVCQTSEGGSIDPDPFRDSDGKLYLYYKSDGNAVGKHSIIWGQRLSDDGLSLVGDAVPLARDDKEWEWKLVEAPSMVRSPAGYQLFFSAAYYGWDYPKERLSNYAIGYATCAGPMGPCADAPENPLLHSFNDHEAGCLSGPGHSAIFQVGERHFMAFHAWSATKGCRPLDPKRYLYIAPLFWKDGKPQLGPSLRVQPESERG